MSSFLDCVVVCFLVLECFCLIVGLLGAVVTTAPVNKGDFADFIQPRNDAAA